MLGHTGAGGSKQSCPFIATAVGLLPLVLDWAANDDNRILELPGKPGRAQGLRQLCQIESQPMATGARPAEQIVEGTPFFGCRFRMNDRAK
jgi:hypothetical protein